MCQNHQSRVSLLSHWSHWSQWQRYGVVLMMMFITIALSQVFLLIPVTNWRHIAQARLLWKCTTFSSWILIPMMHQRSLPFVAHQLLSYLINSRILGISVPTVSRGEEEWKEDIRPPNIKIYDTTYSILCYHSSRCGVG